MLYRYLGYIILVYFQVTAHVIILDYNKTEGQRHDQRINKITGQTLFHSYLYFWKALLNLNISKIFPKFNSTL